MDINRFRKARQSRKELDIPELLSRLRTGDREALSQSITLVESSRDVDRTAAHQLLQSLTDRDGNSWRIGITGMPGAGKSTFINAFGEYLIAKDRKVAVLAVDPSSAVSGGSILGDKTRMPELSVNPSAFIRPSPSGSTLGGVAARTREAIMLCEEAGFDTILVETVGVGQSEIHVRTMVDQFLLLSITGAGDELQGVKRGIMEMLDSLLINKADGDNQEKAARDASRMKQALHLLPGRAHGMEAQVQPVSSLERTGFDIYFDYLNSFFKKNLESGFIKSNRDNQLSEWMDQEIQEEVLRRVQQSNLGNALDKLREDVAEGRLRPLDAIEKVERLLASRIG